MCDCSLLLPQPQKPLIVFVIFQQALLTSNMNILFALLVVVKCNRDHPELENAGHGSELGCIVLDYASFCSFIFMGM